MSHSKAFDGVTAVLVTPYDDGVRTINEDIVTKLVARLDIAGIPVVTALGNTAEAHQLERAERHAVLRAAAQGRTHAQLVAGLAGGMGDVLKDAEYARSLGYHAVMIHEPADPFGDGAGLARYYTEIADRSPLPLVLYLRSARVGGDQLAQLVQHPACVAVKYAREDLFTLLSLLRGPAATACTWINGLAEARVPAFAAAGITSFTSGIANARPDIALAVHRAVRDGDLNRLHELMESYVGPVEAVRADGNGRFNISAIKQLLRWEGIETGGVRAPHSELDEASLAQLKLVMARWRDSAA